MADKKISQLSTYAPVVSSVIFPASYLVDGKYTTGKIEASAIKEFVLKETDSKVATSAELLSFATVETIGKQIYLTTGDTDYSVGLYVVTGANTVQKLAATSASGDFAADIAKLQTKDAELEAKDAEIIASYQATCSDIYNKIEEIKASYTAADSALDSRIAALENAGYATVSQVDTAKGEAVSSANEYTDAQIAAIPAVDLTPYAKQADLTVLEGKVTTNIQAIEKLNGDATVEGSVAKQVTDEIAKVVASAPEDFDTLKEIADYISNDQTGAAQLSNRISTLENAGYATVSEVNTAKGEAVSSANEYTDAQIAAIPAVDLTPYAKQADLTSLNNVVTENERVVSASLNDLNDRVSTLEGFDHTVYALKSEVESADSALSGRIDTLEAIQHDKFATKEEVQNVVTGYTGADTLINETISQLQATIAALQAKLAKYDERFGYQEDGDWTVNFLVID